MARIFLIIAIAAIANTCRAQNQDMRQVLKQMPDSIVPYLTQNNKLDMIDFIDSHMQATITNRLDGQSTLDTLTANYLRLTLTATTQMEMKLLPSATVLPDTTEQVLCVVTRLGERHKTCTVGLYTPNWHRIDGSPLKQAISKAHPNNDTHNAADITELSAHLSPETNTLIVEITYSFVPDEQGQRRDPIHREVMMQWDGKAFLPTD